MGDRTSVAFSIGGTIRVADVPRLAEAIEREGFGLDYGSMARADELAAAILEPDTTGPFIVYDDQCNYANTDDLQKEVEALGLFWRSRWDAGDGYGPGVASWDGVNRRYTETADDETALTESTFKQLEPTYEAVAAWFESHNYEPPPLRIIP